MDFVRGSLCVLLFTNLSCFHPNLLKVYQLQKMVSRFSVTQSVYTKTSGHVPNSSKYKSNNACANSTKTTSDIYGNKLTYCQVKRGASSARCDEYIVMKEPFNFRRWSLLTLTFSSLAFYSEFHNAGTTVLGAILISLTCAFLLKLHLKVKQESLLVIASVGLQFTTTFVTGRKMTRFIFQTDVLDVVINEGITMHRVLHYLAVLLKDSSKTTISIAEVVPLFQSTLPRLDCLEDMYRGLHIG